MLFFFTEGICYKGRSKTLCEMMFVDVVPFLAGDWLVSVTTGPEANMSSSVTVAVCAYGTRSVSELLVLASGEDGTHFAPNASDEFKVSSKIYGGKFEGLHRK